MHEFKAPNIPKINKNYDNDEDNDLNSLDIPLKSLKITKHLSKENPMELQTDNDITIQFPDDVLDDGITHDNKSLTKIEKQNSYAETDHPLTKSISNHSGYYKQILNNDIEVDLGTLDNGYAELNGQFYNNAYITQDDNKNQNNNKITNVSFQEKDSELYHTIYTPDKPNITEDLCFQFPDDINNTSLLNKNNISKQNLENNLVTNSDSASDSDNWDTVPAVASYNIYNSKGELELKKYLENDMRYGNQTPSENNAGPQNNLEHKNTFEYTKVTAEQQAQRSYTTNKKTDFLFQHKKILKNLQTNYNNTEGSINFNLSQQSLINSASTLSLPHDTEEYYDEYEDDAEKTDELNLNSQLNITNLLLTDMEKIAYAGAINILTNKMCEDLATLCLCVDIVANKKLASRLNFSQKDMASWKLVVLQRLYTHLNINEEEIKMIENLSLHRVELSDILKCLKTSRDIGNPWENSPHSQKSSTSSILQYSQQSLLSIPSTSSSPSTSEKDDKNLAKKVVDPEMITNKTTLSVDVAWTIICDLFLVLLQNSTYDARSRTLLIKFAEALGIPDLEVCEFEKRVTDSLDMEQSTDDQIWNESEHMKKRRAQKKRKKMAYVGLAMVGGSLVLGLSGGLLAPVIGAGIAAGLSTIGITGATGFLTGVGGTTVVAVSSTAIGANIGARGMSKRMGSVRTFQFIPLHNNRRVNLLISVSGWIIGNEDDVRLPFSTVDPVEGDLYSLYWEPEMLKSTGQTINIVASEVFTQTIQQVLGATILTAFMSAIQWPMALSKLGYIIDNPWNVSLDRAWSAGLILADTLITRNLGQRPVTLIGFSLGSRVIYSCLIELCKKRALGLVENVFIFGTPVVRKKEQLVMARSVVSGRFVNGYSEKDWVLGYLFRATAGGFSKVMGISADNDIEGIENFNCTELVDGHMSYRKNMPKLLKKLGIEVINEEFVEIEETMDPEQAKRQRKLIREVDAAQKKLAQKSEQTNSWVPKWMRPKKSKWKKMAENAIENQNLEDISSEISIDDQKIKKKPKDAAIVDHSALLRELEKLKKAIHEDALKNQVNNEGSSVPKYLNDSSKHDNSNDMHSVKNQNISNLTAISETNHANNNFQLLVAGRTILPEDNEMKKNVKHKVHATFPDDI